MRFMRAHFVDIPGVSVDNDVTVNDGAMLSIYSMTAKTQTHAIFLKYRNKIDEYVLVKAWVH